VNGEEQMLHIMVSLVSGIIEKKMLILFILSIITTRIAWDSVIFPSTNNNYNNRE
jgi:hypothetical protein